MDTNTSGIPIYFDILIKPFLVHRYVRLSDSIGCAWCLKLRKMWNYLAQQCRQVIFVEVDKEIERKFTEMLSLGNGIAYVKRNGDVAQV